MTQTPEQIASKLTEAQRAMLSAFADTPDWQSVPTQDHMAPREREARAVWALVTKGLLEVDLDGENSGYRLTSLGEQERNQ